MHALRDFHKVFGYTVIVINALSGLHALAACRWPRLRGRSVWAGVIVAEAAMMVQVTIGAILQSNGKFKAPALHMFYGFVAFITVGLLYSYRYVWKAKNRLELAYGLGGLFLMGVGIRGILQVVGK